jgi:hypothetical protein
MKEQGDGRGGRREEEVRQRRQEQGEGRQGRNRVWKDERKVALYSLFPENCVTFLSELQYSTVLKYLQNFFFPKKSFYCGRTRKKELAPGSWRFKENQLGDENVLHRSQYKFAASYM